MLKTFAPVLIFLSLQLFPVIAVSDETDLNYRISQAESAKEELKSNAESIFKDSEETEDSVSQLSIIDSRLEALNFELSNLKREKEIYVNKALSETRQRQDSERGKTLEKQEYHQSHDESGGFLKKLRNGWDILIKWAVTIFKIVAAIGLCILIWKTFSAFHSEQQIPNSPVARFEPANISSQCAVTRQTQENRSASRLSAVNRNRNPLLERSINSADPNATHDGRIPENLNLGKENKMLLPNWVKRNQEKYVARFDYEIRRMSQSFPSFELLQDEQSGETYWEGQLCTNSQNIYNLKIFYTDRYPYEPPLVIVMDSDVKRFCKKEGLHGCHNWGIKKGGAHICVINPDDTVNVGWEHSHSVISMAAWAAEWLHAYEVKIKTGRWILPE